MHVEDPLARGMSDAQPTRVAEILVVDDDEDVGWMLEQILALDGHEVRVTHNGEEALRALRGWAPEMVVLDVEMPILDGPGLAYRMFVHNAGMENIPIVLISGVLDLRHVAERVGTPYFIAKPFTPARLLGLVHRALEERTLPRPAQ